MGILPEASGPEKQDRTRLQAIPPSAWLGLLTVAEGGRHIAARARSSGEIRRARSSGSAPGTDPLAAPLATSSTTLVFQPSLGSQDRSTKPAKPRLGASASTSKMKFRERHR